LAVTILALNIPATIILALNIPSNFLLIFTNIHPVNLKRNALYLIQKIVLCFFEPINNSAFDRAIIRHAECNKNPDNVMAAILSG
jgi:hypothetical protein